MNLHRNLFLFLLLTAALLGGCRTVPTAPPPPDNTKYTIENTGKFVLLDQTMQTFISCTGLQERFLPDGRLEIVANVKNREDRLLKVQANCVFKDEQGFSTGDETPFQTLTLPGNATQAVKFTSANNLARNFTIRVRQPL